MFAPFSNCTYSITHIDQRSTFFYSLATKKALQRVLLMYFLITYAGTYPCLGTRTVQVSVSPDEITKFQPDHVGAASVPVGKGSIAGYSRATPFNNIAERSANAVSDPSP
jgi:hypothetical protein